MLFATKRSTLEAQLRALDKSQAVIEFALDGTILTANENFLEAMGYTLEEVKGEHHRMFVEPDYAQSAEYEAFWEQLRSGEFMAAEYPRIAKGGRDIWIQASYNPVLDSRGKPIKVVKYATDITKQKLQTADYEGQLDAINKSQAVIEFSMDGTILTANENFLGAVGYSLDEIKGQHHRMFVEPGYAQGAEYQAFWEQLRRGEFSAAEYLRYGKGGKEIWIQASYNPILDDRGKPFKVVKFATDITDEKMRNADFSGQLEAIGKSQAVIEFSMDGNILTANQNFLGAMGYTLDEVKGQHHRIFVEPGYAQSAEYEAFWEKLRRGEFSSAEFQRFGKGGKEVWIQASYNPILDAAGKPFKVVKYATDITAQVQARIEAGELTETARMNIQTVAASSEEMLASINEISTNMVDAKSSVDDISEKITHADGLTGRLQDNVNSMEGVVKLIREIAEQVSLLALNATIEAARAGEEGKGFAVVAGEVKNLATQTSNATDEIAAQIAAMQEIAGDVSQSTNIISATCGSVSQYVNGVASAIEEQTAVTNDISVNMQQVSTGVTQLDECVKRIAG